MASDKTQAVRLLDVFVFGPLMVRAAADQKSPYFSTALTLIGIGTIAYNGVNYLQHRQQERQALEGLPNQIAPWPGRCPAYRRGGPQRPGRGAFPVRGQR